MKMIVSFCLRRLSLYSFCNRQVSDLSIFYLSSTDQETKVNPFGRETIHSPGTRATSLNPPKCPVPNL
jgi:hypothetical protein